MANIPYSTHLSAPYSLDPTGKRATWDKIYLGFVKKTNDSMHMGRILVYVPELRGDTDTEATWIVCDYASPFAGATNIAELNQNSTSGQTSYGMTFIPPDINNQVLIGFINGDPNRGFWFACLFPVNANKMVPSTPALTNNTQGKEANKVTGTVAPDIPAHVAAQDAGTAGLPISQGGPATQSMGTGITSMGIRTPRGHSVVLEDDPTSGFVRLQTRFGAQILLNDNTDRIIISTGSGKARIELDREGNIDVFAHQNFSVRAEGDINLSAKNNINISAEQNINQQSYGTTHVHSTGDYHVKGLANMFFTSSAEMHRIANGSIFDTSTRMIQRYANYGILDTTTNGPIEIRSGDSIHIDATDGTFDLKSTDSIKIQSVTNDINLLSATSLKIQSGASLYLKSTNDTRIQTDANFDILATSLVKIQSTNADIDLLSSNGLMNFQSNGNANFKAGGNVSIQGNGNVDLKPGSGAVRTTKNLIINAGVIPDAGSAVAADPSIAATVADDALPSKQGVPAEDVTVKQIVITTMDGNATPTKTTELVNSIVSRMPSADPSPTRAIAGPGFTNLVKRKDSPPESTYKTGQVTDSQTVPLQVIGVVNGGSFGRYVGDSWNSSGTPVYNFQDIPTTMYQLASKYSTSANGLRLIEFHEGTGGLPPNRPGWAFPDSCNSGQQLIGYGHVLTATEIQTKMIKIGSATVDYTSGISEVQMKTLLQTDVVPIENKIKAAIGKKNITQDQFDVLVDFIYNVGIDEFDNSEIANLILSDKYNEVPNTMIRYIVACGVDKPELKARRLENCMLWSGQVSSAAAVQFTRSSKASSLATSEQARTVYCYFVSRGYTPAVACGFIGNMIRESSLNPADGQYGHSDGSNVGLISWSRPRRAAIAQHFGSFDITSITTQCGYVVWELNTLYRSVAASLNTVSSTDTITACNIINQYYEASESGQAERGSTTYTLAVWEWEAEARRANAQAAYDKFANDPNSCTNITPVS
jgi:lysozyme